MKRVLIFLVSLIMGTCLYAQNVNSVVPPGYEVVDSIVFRPAAALDSALVGQTIFAYPGIELDQESDVEQGMASHILNNSGKSISGYRVRIFFDNKQDSRTASEEAVLRFHKLHPGVPVYRSYLNPYFKVTVGDFRNKSEAMQLLQQVVSNFPSAFIVKEKINYPAVNNDDAYVIDTLHLIRKISAE